MAFSLTCMNTSRGQLDGKEEERRNAPLGQLNVLYRQQAQAANEVMQHNDPWFADLLEHSRWCQKHCWEDLKKWDGSTWLNHPEAMLHRKARMEKHLATAYATNAKWHVHPCFSSSHAIFTAHARSNDQQKGRFQGCFGSRCVFRLWCWQWCDSVSV